MQWTKGNAGATSVYSSEKTWKPDKAEVLQGTLTSKKSIKGNDGELVTILKIEDADGVVWNVWASRKALRDLVEEYDEQLIVGRFIGIKCGDSQKVEGTSRTYFPYELGFAEADDIPTPQNNVMGDEEPF